MSFDSDTNPDGASCANANPSRHIAIIGAGPAGSVAAIGLARAGFTVTLVEQHRFPRDKVCGECLSSLGVAALSRLDLLPALHAAGAVPLTRALLHAQDGSHLCVDLPTPMLGVSRRLLDSHLLVAARASGATIRQPARCERLTPGNPVRFELRCLETNRVDALTCDHLLLADGRGALLPDRPTPTQDFGAKAHFHDVECPANAIELFGVDGHYGGIAPVEGGLWNISFSVPAARIAQHAGDLDALFARTVDENPSLKRRMRRAARAGPWLSSPLPRFPVRHDWPTGVIPLGNAAAALEPIGGEGMGLAMCSAELAVHELVAVRDEGRAIDIATLRRHFDSLWKPRRLACRLAARVVSSPTLAPIALSLADHLPVLPQAALRLMGKSAQPT